MHLAHDEGGKIALALDAMQELLEMQTARGPWRPSVIDRHVEPFDRNSSCGTHENCAEYMDSVREAIVVSFPDCRTRRYIRSSGEVFFVVLSEFSELSRRIGIGESECGAWESALAGQSQHNSL